MTDFSTLQLPHLGKQGSDIDLEEHTSLFQRQPYCLGATAQPTVCWERTPTSVHFLFSRQGLMWSRLVLNPCVAEGGLDLLLFRLCCRVLGLQTCLYFSFFFYFREAVLFCGTNHLQTFHLSASDPRVAGIIGIIIHAWVYI